MAYVIDERVDEPIMMLDRHIGMDEEDGMGIDGAMFAQELLRLDNEGKKVIHVYINCPGGSVVEGMSIFNAILRSKTPVDTHNIGIAASMGGVVFMAGRKRYMSDYASLMIHNPTGSDNKGMISSMTDSLSTMLSAKSGLTKDDVAYLMKKETWLNSAECFAKGFCTEITITSESNKKRMSEVKNPTPTGNSIDEDVQNPTPGGNELGEIQNPTPSGNRINARAMWKVATEITNNIFNKNTDMKKVTAKLGLTENSNEDAIVTAIVNAENKAKNDISAAQNSVTELTNKLTAETGKVTALGTTIKSVTAKLGLRDDATQAEIETAMDKVITDAKASAKAAEDALIAKAAAKVTAAVKVGKIANKAEAIASWNKLLIADFDGTEKLIDELPLNKVANKIDVVTGTTENVEALKSAGTAAGRMLEIENGLKKK